jgi:large subunit ribosomal protein L20
MPRTKGGVVTRRRHKKILKLTKGQFGARHRIFRRANEAMLHALEYATRDRRQRKREFRRLWIARINAGARQNGLSYSRLMYGLRQANVALDRKVLADLAVSDARTFAQVVEVAKAAL